MDDELTKYIAERERTLEDVRSLLISVLRVPLPPAMIDPDAILFGSGLGLDSVDSIELVVALESRYRLRVPDGSLRMQLRTVNSVVDLLMSEVSEETRAAARGASR